MQLRPARPLFDALFNSLNYYCGLFIWITETGHWSNLIVLKDPADQVNKNFFVFATDIFCEFLCFNLSSLDVSDLNNHYPRYGFVCNFLICKGIQLHFNCFWALYSHLCSAPKFWQTWTPAEFHLMQNIDPLSFLVIQFHVQTLVRVPETQFVGAFQGVEGT